MKKIMALALALAAGATQAAPVYVGSWYVGEGPWWESNPTVYSAQETAALLFGGIAANYSISTISDQVADINFMAFVDGWGDSQYLFAAVAQNFKLDSGAPGYNEPYGGPAYSAYVLDHSCNPRYDDPGLTCEAGEPGLNFAFYDAEAAPEPAALGMLGLGLAVLGAARRRKQA